MEKLIDGRVMGSEFMQWSKSHVHVKYNLASSGISNYPLSALPCKLEDLEITGDSFYGYDPLLQAISELCGVSKERIFSTIGTSLANHIAMAVMIAPGDEVLIESPTYELLISTAQYLGARIKRFPRHAQNGFRIRTADIQEAITQATRLVVMTNLHNPSSAYTDEATLASIGKIASSVGARVLVDEVYLDAAFDIPHRTSAHLGGEFIVTNSLTKVYGLSGLRCGWVLAEPQLINRMWRLNDLFEVIPAHPAERLSTIALNNLGEPAARARSILSENHKECARFIKEREDLELTYHGVGTVVFPRLKMGNVDRLSGELLENYETSIAPGRFFGMPEHFRIGLGVDPAIFRQGLKHLEKALGRTAGAA